MKRLAVVDPGGEDAAGREIPGAQALRRGLSLLDIVADEAGLRFSEIAERAGLTRATAHRMLSTLVEAGLLRVDERDQSYHLGFRLFEMAHRVWDQFDLRSAAEPELERLRDLAGETVRLAILDRDEILYVDQREAHQAVRLGNGVGGRAAAHASGAGKAILAHLEPLIREQLLNRLALRRFTPNTITDRADLAQHLDLTKARGYAVSFEEQNDGVSSVAAAILDHKARAIGAVAIVGPAYRLGLDRLHALGRDVMAAARRISGNAGQVAMSITTSPRPLGPDRGDVASVVPTTAFLGEGPTWLPAERRIAFVDILAPAVIVADPADGSFQAHPMPELVSAVVPRRRGGWLVAMQTGLKAVDPDFGKVTTIAAPEAGKPGNRFNDGKCDRRGRFWAGTLAIDTTPGHGSLYRLDADGRCTRMDEGFHVSNGLGWSPDDRRFYFTDTGAGRIHVYDFDLETGTIANRRLFAEVAPGTGVPDGLAVDAEGFVWSAHWDGWCITRYDPDGRVDRVINLPVPRPTSCCFGGPDLSTLYVTSARIRLNAQQLAEAPLSGSVFAVQAGVRGLPETPFAG
ncbi:SMP-30/gluconolactonase/LRE family protein [Prosthecomicrobium sp. N25]|uniref:SMP-30/gluconolactonase/LRE family protein n=1 Tax=Prosthecomicrobium sp. N25 TaxID=3129254 RepID=UPI003076CDC1